MNSNSPPNEDERLMTMIKAPDMLFVLATDHFKAVLKNPIFAETNRSYEVGRRKNVHPKPLRSRERTPARHSAFRLFETAHEKVTDAEMLEMALCSQVPPRRLASVTRMLLDRFSNFPGVIRASLDDLREIDGLGEGGIAAIKTIQAAAVRLARAEIIDRPIIGNWNRLIEYLNIIVSHEKSEHLRILYLDAQNRVIGEELQSKGTVSGVTIQLRDLVQRVLRMNATAVILVHNHPSGNPKPSKNDLALTQAISMGLRLISVALFDHVIIGKEGWFSFRKEHLL